MFVIHDPSTGSKLLESAQLYNPVVKGLKILNNQLNQIYEPDSILTISEVLISNNSPMGVPAGAKLLFSSTDPGIQWLEKRSIILPFIPPHSTQAISAWLQFKTPPSALPDGPRPFGHYVRILAMLTLLDHPFHRVNPEYVLGIQHSIKFGSVVGPCVLRRSQVSKIVGLIHNIAPCETLQSIRVIVKHHSALVFDTTSIDIDTIPGNCALGFKFSFSVSGSAVFGQALFWKIILLLNEKPVEYFQGGNRIFLFCYFDN